MRNSDILLYVAAPYTHCSINVMRERYEQVTDFAEKLMKRGFLVYSPLSYTVPFHLDRGVEHPDEYWLSLDKRIFTICDILLIYGLDGWSKSKGIKVEMDQCSIAGKPHNLVVPGTPIDVIEARVQQMMLDWLVFKGERNAGSTL